MTITEAIRKHNIKRRYDGFQPWLEENGFTIQDLPLTATTSLGEDLILNAYYQDGELIWKTEFLQGNGWIRVQIYYPDGTIEEAYER